MIYKITKKNTIDKRFKSLFAYGTDEFSSVSNFSNTRTGKPTRVFKTTFKSVFGTANSVDPIEVWNKSL